MIVCTSCCHSVLASTSDSTPTALAAFSTTMSAASHSITSRPPCTSRWSPGSSSSASSRSRGPGAQLASILVRFNSTPRNRSSASSSFDVGSTWSLPQSTSTLGLELHANNIISYDIADANEADTCSRWIRHSTRSVTSTSTRRPHADRATSCSSLLTRTRRRYSKSSSTATKSMSLPGSDSPRATDPYSHTSPTPTSTRAWAARRASSRVGAALRVTNATFQPYPSTASGPACPLWSGRGRGLWERLLGFVAC